MSTPERGVAEIVADGLAFPECPRWHADRLWLADMHVGSVLSYDTSAWGDPIVELQLDAHGADVRTAGFGFLPDDRMLAVSSLDSTVLRRETDGSIVVHADLRESTRGWCNDMVVDRQGRAYVGSYGADFKAGEAASDVPLALVERDGTSRSVGDPLTFPNGMVIMPDRGTLVVGESMARRMTAFSVADDGSLSDRRVWAPLPAEVRPDGSCLDADGAIWVSSFMTGEVLRVHEGGAITHVVEVPDRLPFACMLGGADRRTLYVCAANTWRDDETVRDRAGVIAQVRVHVPGAGWP